MSGNDHEIVPDLFSQMLREMSRKCPTKSMQMSSKIPTGQSPLPLKRPLKGPYYMPLTSPCPGFSKFKLSSGGEKFYYKESRLSLDLSTL